MIKIKEMLAWLISYSDINKCEYISKETIITYVKEILEDEDE